MDEIYNILIAAVVGFALNPVTETIKLSIAARDNKKKLINKLIISKDILANAIRTLNTTCTLREAFINQNDLNHPVFLLPFIKTPNLHDDFDKCYLSLSENQRNIIEVVIYGLAHATKLESKAEKFDDSLKDVLNETKYTDIKEIKAAHDRYYKRILACEKAMLYSLVTIRKNLELAINDKPQQNTDAENFSSTSEELGISFNISWWPYLRPEQNVSPTDITDAGRI
ncbi:hypothetical protein QF008_001374 [Pseudomonas protegens]|uniref:hypothetical protein n=1 Tax=Pseudomonas protegens TaxID=380021 RepID=UPI002895E9D6|nr:hypothetical protein [Pseudomonas protegens]MDT3419643.1 hypothetical protein [Pseudomonas protegens]